MAPKRPRAGTDKKAELVAVLEHYFTTPVKLPQYSEKKLVRKVLVENAAAVWHTLWDEWTECDLQIGDTWAFMNMSAKADKEGLKDISTTRNSAVRPVVDQPGIASLPRTDQNERHHFFSHRSSLNGASCAANGNGITLALLLHVG